MPSALLYLLVIICQASGHVYTDSINMEEYDFHILDPHAAYGSPYGGFSRATRSRLAALPLHLLSKEQEEEQEPMYMEVIDSDGQAFACRVYHEDELDPDSFDDSMFDAPRLRKEVSVEVNKSSNKEDIDDRKGTAEIGNGLANQNSGETPSASSISTKLGKAGKISEIDAALSQNDNTLIAQLRLSELSGICGQLHKGWWSYEWCYETTVSQFHLQFEAQDGQVQIESVSTLGRYHSRTVLVDFGADEKLPNNYAEGQTEIARVVDEYTDGQLCDEGDQQPRKAFVHMQCCGPEVMDKTRGLLHRDGKRIQSHDAAVMHIAEDPTCTYNVTVCTPLLCRESAERSLLQDDEENDGAVAPPGSRKPPGGDETVRELLRRALGNYCLQSESGGWWTYEYCHERKVRQYHEAIGTSKTESGSVVMTRTLDSEHILGLYDPANNAHLDEDWRFVVNTTSSTIGGGNGAYFELEYTGGEVCDHSDVTDAAIIAGSAGVGGVERASSVRYYCGNSYSVSVNEDSTCHYIVHVIVPDLCKHPLFVAPVSKRKVVKCLPVD